MSNFNNNGLGDGGLQNSKEKLRTHTDDTPMRDYKQLTYEELEKKIGDALHSGEFESPLTKAQQAEADESWRQFELANPLVDAPEGWEEKRRAELNKSVRSGAYCIDGKLWTGKGGYIDFQIAMEKSAKRYK